MDDSFRKHFTDAYLHQDQRIKELKHQNEILVEELNESKQEIQFLKQNIDQLTIVNQQQGTQIEKQGKSVQRLEHFVLTYFNKLPGISALLSFVLKNDKQHVFDNLIDFLLNRYVPDCYIMETCWSYRQESKIILIWFVTDFKERQQKQMHSRNSAIISPYFSTGKKGYLVRVIFDPYGHEESRGTHLSCCLLADKEGPYDSDIKFPHQQQLIVTIINPKNRQNDVAAIKTFQMSRPPVKWDQVQYAHKILSLTDVNEFILNDKLILEIHVNYCSAK